MKNELIFGDLSNKRMYVTLDNKTITIKNGGLALFGIKNTNKETNIMINDISSITIDTPTLHPKKWGMKIIQNSGATFIIPIFNIKQKDAAIQLKSEVERLKNSSTTISNNVEDNYDKLEKLKKLLDNNVITKDEFEKEKEKILNGN